MLTQGATVHRITGTALPDRYISFDLSDDGKSVVWIDDVIKGPLIADVSGANMRRITVTPEQIGPVVCNANASVIYFEAFDRTGNQLWRINRDGTGEVKLHSSAAGRFFVARGSGQVRLEQFDPRTTPPGSSLLMTGAKSSKMFDLQRRDVVGTSAWSDDGRVFVWRSRTSSGVYETLIWRAGS